MTEADKAVSCKEMNPLGTNINLSESNETNESNKTYVSVKQFVNLIWQGYLLYKKDSVKGLNSKDEDCVKQFVETGDLSPECVLNYGWDKGWLEEQDILWKDRFIERRNAARIIHEFLRIQCGEADEDNWRDAEKLTDLYHCKVCAKHVAQAYLKGIMPAKEEKRFQLLFKIDEIEAGEIVSRAFNEKKRLDYLYHNAIMS